MFRLSTVLTFSLSLLLPGLLCAQEPAPPRAAEVRIPYQPAGAPVDPKVPAQWNRYLDHAQISELLKKLVAAYPRYARLQSLGKSYGEREMWVLTLTDFQTGNETEKPAFWIDGGIHANEIQSVEVVLYTAWYVLESRERVPFLQKLLQDRVLYLCPMLSPDSRDSHLYQANTTHSPRTGQRPVDDDRDGKFDEDGPDDLNGDGHITQMRIRDPRGKHKPHPDYPELMIPVAPGETGSYTLIDNEGFDNDGDGEVDEDGPGYYDPNRDWGWNWQPGYVQNGAHRYPNSILENRYAADFIAAHPNIAGAQSYHNTGGMILRGPGAKDDRFAGADVAVYDQLGKTGESLLPGYRYMTTGEDLYEVFGGELDWMHHSQGIFGFTNELFTPFNLFRKTDNKGFFASREELHRFNKYLLLGSGFVPWQEVQHPQFGKIEVGGLKKNWQRQPPSFLLEEECHRNMAFTLYHADQMPQVAVEKINTRLLEGGLVEVTATIINRKLTPTHSAADVKNKLTTPDLVTLSGPDVQVLVGWTADDPLFQTPSEQKRQPATLKVPTVPGNGTVYTRWLVRGNGPYTVQIRSPKGGVAELNEPRS